MTCDMILRKAALVACLALGVAAAARGETYRFGKWTLQGGSFALSYDGHRLAEGVDVGFWSSGYKQSLVSGRWVAAPAPNGVTFTREFPAAKFVLAFTFENAKVRQTLDCAFRQTPGPVEYGISMNPARFPVAPGHAMLRLDGAYAEVSDNMFPTRGARRLSWETPEAAYSLATLGKNQSFILQDRRHLGERRLRFIHCSRVEEPSRMRFEHVWDVTTFADAATIATRRDLIMRLLALGAPLPVTNADFEQGRAGWALPSTARIDTNVFHRGKASLRMDVKEPRRSCVYVTRHVPVTPGGQYRASCWLKTCGVREVTERDISQCGATLIVEWADRKGKWMQGGEYARALWGTNDWKHVELPRLTAPPGAGYAIVFLTLRAAGTAWFDDFRLSKATASVSKFTPTEGEKVASNCPRFTWRPFPGWRRSTIMLSKDASFPPEKTRVCEAGGMPEYRLEQSLEPGLWYWKVVSTGMDDAMPSYFTVTMPREADGLPPRVVTRARRVVAGDEPFTVDVRELTAETPFVTLEGAGPAVTGVCIARSPAHVLTYRFTPPKGGWPKGFSEAATVARDAAGNVERRPFYLLNSPKPANAVVIDADGHFRESGRRIFPFGIYEVDPEYMREVRAHKFDAVHIYRWEGSQDDVACRRYLDQCWAADGLRAFIGFDRGNGSGDGLVQGNLPHVARRVGALADHPALFCWYLFDEPEIIGQFIAPDLLTAYADLVRALDPFHTVVMTTWNKSMIEYRRTWDTHWTQAYGNPRVTLDRLEQERGYLRGESPITLLINCNDGPQGRLRRKGVEPDPAKFALDTPYMRACSFLGVTRECNGLWWWWFARRTHEFYTAGQNPKAWAGVGQILRELDALRPVITADEKPVYGLATSGKAKVSWWCKKVAGKTTFLAVNTENGPVTVEIDVPGLGKKTYSFERYEVKHLTW